MPLLLADAGSAVFGGAGPNDAESTKASRHHAMDAMEELEKYNDRGGWGISRPARRNRVRAVSG